MLPLTRIGVPVADIVLTLMLSLRFISLVFDEVGYVQVFLCWIQFEDVISFLHFLFL